MKLKRIIFLSVYVLLTCTVLMQCNTRGSSEDSEAKSTGKEDEKIIEDTSLLSKSMDTVVVEMVTEGINLNYSIPEIRAKAGVFLLIKYTNKSDMNHNIVFVKEEGDIRPVGMAALEDAANDWIPKKEMNRIIAYSKLAYSGETVELLFRVPPPGTYPFICTYSAHWTQMQGRLIATE